jgi:myxalamid-type nonribosomal peptide synthetase MxaA
VRRGDQGRPDEALDSALPGAEDGAHGNGLPAELVGERARMELLALGDGGSCSVHLEAGTLYDLLLGQAQRTPDELAVVDGDFGLTYRELVRRSNGVALRLQALGVQPGQPVAILVDRAAESLIGVLGICASGGAYVPIDVAHPDERTDFRCRSE